MKVSIKRGAAQEHRSGRLMNDAASTPGLVALAVGSRTQTARRRTTASSVSELSSTFNLSAEAAGSCSSRIRGASPASPLFDSFNSNPTLAQNRSNVIDTMCVGSGAVAYADEMTSPAWPVTLCIQAMSVPDVQLRHHTVPRKHSCLYTAAMAQACTATAGPARLQPPVCIPSCTHSTHKASAATYACQPCDMGRRRQVRAAATSVSSSSSSSASSNSSREAAISVHGVDLTFTGRGISKKVRTRYHLRSCTRARDVAFALAPAQGLPFRQPPPSIQLQ